MDRGVLVDLRHGVHETRLRATLGQADAADGDAGLLGTLHEAALVGQVVGALAHADDREGGGHALAREATGTAGAVLGDRGGDGCTVQQLSHGSAPSS